MDDLDTLVGQRVREYRTKRGLSQEKLGELSDLHFSYIGQVERGEKSPSLRSLISIARALGISVSELLDSLQPLPDETESLVQQFRTLVADCALQDVELCLQTARLFLDHCRRLRKEA